MKDKNNDKIAFAGLVIGAVVTAFFTKMMTKMEVADQMQQYIETNKEEEA